MLQIDWSGEKQVGARGEKEDGYSSRGARAGGAHTKPRQQVFSFVYLWGFTTTRLDHLNGCCGRILSDSPAQAKKQKLETRRGIIEVIFLF